MNVKYIAITNHTYFFFDGIISIKQFNPNNIKVDKKYYKNILIYYIGYIRQSKSTYEFTV